MHLLGSGRKAAGEIAEAQASAAGIRGFKAKLWRPALSALAGAAQELQLGKFIES